MLTNTVGAYQAPSRGGDFLAERLQMAGLQQTLASQAEVPKEENVRLAASLSDSTTRSHRSQVTAAAGWSTCRVLASRCGHRTRPCEQLCEGGTVDERSRVSSYVIIWARIRRALVSHVAGQWAEVRVVMLARQISWCCQIHAAHASAMRMRHSADAHLSASR